MVQIFPIMEYPPGQGQSANELELLADVDNAGHWIGAGEPIGQYVLLGHVVMDLL